MGKSSRKMKRHEAAPVGSYRYDKACNRIAEQAIYQVLTLAIDILWNDFGGLQRRNTRLKFFADNFRERLEKIDQGFTPAQQAAMDELQRQAGYSVICIPEKGKENKK